MDFNDDGILDLVLGERNGYYNFYTGNGDGTLHFVGYPFDDQGDPIEREYNSSGYLSDWNGDGYLDFIAGGYNTVSTTGGVLHVHLNTSDDLTSPVWSSTVIDLTSLCNKWRLTHQTFDLDIDGDMDLVFGYEMGNVWYAENIGTGTDPAFNGYEQLVCDGGNIDVYGNFSGGGRARENVTDFNDDGIPDILVGCNSGWIYLFEGYGTGIEEGCGTAPDYGIKLSCTPTTGQFTVDLSLPSHAAVEIKVFDASGRAVEAASSSHGPGSHSIPMDLTGDPAGIYFVSTSVNGTRETLKLIRID